MPASITGSNLHKPIRKVRHVDLERLNAASPFRSWCPVCVRGVLLVARLPRGDPNAGHLSRLDRCSTCGQHVLYTDDTIAGEAVFQPAQALPSGYPAIPTRSRYDRILADDD